MIDILTRALELHDTHRDGNARREQQLRDVFARMTSAESLALHRRLGNPAASDEQDPAYDRLVDRELLRRFDDAILVTSTHSRKTQAHRSVVEYQMTPPPAAQRMSIWRRTLPQANADVIEAAASTYALTPGGIIAAARNAIARVGKAADVGTADVHEGLRSHLDDQLRGVATRVSCTQSWKDLVLPTDQLEQVAELVARVRHRSLVLDEWGFADKVGRGIGIAALLSGPPGTGKTMVAGLIANELGLDLYQVDVARVVSKYIGETEKNLAAVFDAAETGHVVLLFDEADSLFAKRSEVKSSNDRYANQEVNYLLQRIEQFRGIVVLTTNHEASLDEALRRRLSIHVRFQIPDEEQRQDLWQAMLPDRAERSSDIDFARLARDYEMTGGYIKNAVLRAAYMAADAGSSISMEFLWRAARAEYEAMGKVAYHAAG